MRLPLGDRLREVEVLLRWEGQVSNARLREVLGCHFTYAARLIAEYRQQFPDRISAPERGRAIVARHLESEPVVGAGGLPDYVALLERAPRREERHVHILHAVRDDIPPQVFAPVMRAIRNKSGVSCTYRSMAEPEPHARTLFPHAAVHTQGRWHVRAYCMQREEFRDYVVSRLQHVIELPEPAAHGADQDDAWNESVTLEIVAHPSLSPAQAALIRDERFRGRSSTLHTVRAALGHYVLQELRVAIDPERHGPPDYVLALRPTPTTRPWRFDAAQ